MDVPAVGNALKVKKRGQALTTRLDRRYEFSPLPQLQASTQGEVKWII
jgi:hypothetical protein